MNFMLFDVECVVGWNPPKKNKRPVSASRQEIQEEINYQSQAEYDANEEECPGGT